MKQRAIALSSLVLFAFSAFAAASPEALRIDVKDKLLPGQQQDIVLRVYPVAVGGAPVATETRRVTADANGAIATPVGALAYGATDSGERWLSVQVNGRESRRVRIETARSLPIVLQVVSSAAISANGMIESVAQGFRFPDGSIQTSAATVSGGVPSVNGIGTAVTIAADGTATVSTVGSTITVSTPTFGTPVSNGTSNSPGVSTSMARADHVHSHGSLPGGSLHAFASPSNHGFMAMTDKAKLDAVVQYARTVVVGPVGSTTANGTTLRNALANISSPSSINPYVVKIEPGIYDVGSTPLQMRSYVDIEGSGENVTTIRATCGNASSSSTTSASAIVSAANAELRQLTVSNVASLAFANAFFVNAGPMSLSRVTLLSTGATDTSIGLNAAEPVLVYLQNVTITATNAGGSANAIGAVASVESTVTIKDSTLTAQGVTTGTNSAVLVSGATSVTIDSSTLSAMNSATLARALFVISGTATVSNSTLRADAASTRYAAITTGSQLATVDVFHSRLLVYQSGSSSALSASRGANSTLRIAASQLDGATTGTPTCVQVYDGNFASVGSTCPVPTP